MSTIRSIVVHLDATPRTEVRLRIAQALASALDAQLTGLYAATPSTAASPVEMPEVGSVVSPSVERPERERLENAKALFERVIDRGATPSPRWEDSGRTSSYTALAARALTADLVVFGQHDAAEPLTTMESDLVASTLIESGTPALVVPHFGSFAPDTLAQPGLTVLVAWKPTREAAHAVRAALPWLQRARRVHIAAESASPEGPHPWPGPGPVSAWLQLHGVGVEIRAHSVGQADPGELLLSMAADVSADLLVMGCFGHSRARELVLGGASRTVLRSMTLPTLMAH